VINGLINSAKWQFLYKLLINADNKHEIKTVRILWWC